MVEKKVIWKQNIRKGWLFILLRNRLRKRDPQIFFRSDDEKGKIFKKRSVSRMIMLI